MAPHVGQSPQYLLTIEDINITPPPPWIRANIKSEVLRDGGLTGTISILDPWETITPRVRDAFEFHPWVLSVERITKRPPRSLEVELKYRRPIAAVECSDEGRIAFLPIDEHAVRLPDADFTDAERRHLPRISGASGQPRVGDKWEDPRILGAAKLAAALIDVWQQLHLMEILPGVEPGSSEERPEYLYEIVTTGGTRIMWGAAPGQNLPTGESTMDRKRQQLLDYAAQSGQLESIDGPARLDVRKELIVTPRTAREKTRLRATKRR